MDQIAVTADGALHLLAEVGGSVEGLLNGLHGEVSVATVDNLEKGDLRVASQVDILGTISDELHKTTGTHDCCLCLELRKKFWKLRGFPQGNEGTYGTPQSPLTPPFLFF